MKYTILINQAAIVEAGLHKTTDLVDWAILEYINGWQTNPEAQRINDFVWINYKHFIEEMPLVGLNTKSGVSNRLKKLEELLLIEKIHDEDGRAFCKTTALFHQVTQFKIKKSGRGGVHNDERGVHNGERGVHNGEQSTNNQNIQPKQIIKNNNNAALEQSETFKNPSDKIPLLSLSFLNQEQTAKAIVQLKQLTPNQQALAIAVFNEKAKGGLSGFEREPIAYWNYLISIGKKGEIKPPKMAISQTTELQATPSPQKPAMTLKERENTRLECIKVFVASKKADLLKEFAEHGFVTSRGIGMIIEPDLKLAGLFD